MADDPHDDYPDNDCPNCGGTGFVYDCIDGCCLNAEDGCDLCERRCDWCTITNPAKTMLAANCHDDLVAALGDTLRILDAVRYSSGLGTKQLDRMDRARIAFAKAKGGAQ